MNEIKVFKVGDTYTNDQIRFSLHLENLGGIRPAVDSQKRLRHVAIMTAAEESGKLHAENPYHDRIEGDILTYTAQGREGDQSITGRNKRLIEQYSVPTPFFGFINLGKQNYRFLGLLELLRHYHENQADRRGNLRQVWIFEFRIHKQPEIVPIEQASVISGAIIAESRKQNPLTDLEREVAELPSEEEAAEADQVTFESESLRAQLLQIEPFRFERVVKALMEKSGFCQVMVTRPTGDGGIDVNAFVEDSNDFFAGTHVQAQVKRWRHSVGSVEINSFRGALNTTAKGVFITTSHYTRAAIAEARHTNKPCITLIDGNRLSSLIVARKVNLDTIS